MPCVILALVVLAIWPTDHTSGAARIATSAGVLPVAQDRPAPAFSRPLVTGAGQINLSELRGRVVVVNFWASWCTACQNEVPRLRALARQRQPHGVGFLGVDDEDTRSAARIFLDRFQPGYRSVFDPGGSLLRAFGSAGVPSTFIVDRAGRIRYQAIGAFDATAFGRAIDRVAG